MIVSIGMIIIINYVSVSHGLLIVIAVVVSAGIYVFSFAAHL